jgi:hypothetical protein
MDAYRADVYGHTPTYGERETERGHSLRRFIARWLGVDERAGKVCTMHDIASIAKGAISGRYRARWHSALALSALSPLRWWIDLFDTEFRSSSFPAALAFPQRTLAFPSTRERAIPSTEADSSPDCSCERNFVRRYYRHARSEGVEEAMQDDWFGAIGAGISRARDAFGKTVPFRARKG